MVIAIQYHLVEMKYMSDPRNVPFALGFCLLGHVTIQTDAASALQA